MLELERRTMKMQLQGMSRRGLLLIMIGFISLFFISILIGGLGPHVYEYKSVSSWECPKGVNTFSPQECAGRDLSHNTSYWVGEIRHLDKLNQQLQLVISPENVFKNKQSIDKSLKFMLSLKARNANSNWKTIVENDIHKRDLDCKENDDFCANITIAHEPFINYENYQFNISILNAESVDGISVVGDVWFTFVFIHSSFTFFELWFRFVFLIATFAVLLVFAWSLRGYSFQNEWSLEQKWTSILLFGLILYNNPVFPLEILVSGWFPVFLDQVFIGTFLFLLLLSWLVMFDGIKRYNQRFDDSKFFLKFYLPKIIFVGVFWVLAVIIYTWQELQTLDDPEFDSLYDIPQFLFFYILFIIFFALYIGWLGYLLVRSLSADHKMLPYLGVRIQFFGVFTLLIIFFVILGIVFGMVGPVHNNAAEFLSYLSVLNLYVYVLAIVYLPAKPSNAEDDPRKMIGMVRLEGSEASVGRLSVDTMDGGSSGYLGRIEAGLDGDSDEESSSPATPDNGVPVFSIDDEED